MIEVSVIIASYNVESYIERAVRSALDQQGVKLEVIVIDDCSTDATWQIVCAIDDPRLRMRRNHENCGPSVTRNEAIAMANGRWIAVLDGDDEFMAGRLQRCLTHAADADIVVDNIEIRREKDKKFLPMFPSAEFARRGTLHLPGFIDGNCLFARGYSLGYLKPIFSAEFMHRNNLLYDPGLRIGEDYLLFAQALAMGARCLIESSIGYAYTVRARSISHRLALSDIDRMMATDQNFLSQHTLDGAALTAQKRRSKSLHTAYNFTQLITAIKGKNIASACCIATACPGSLWLLRLPVLARVKRLLHLK